MRKILYYIFLSIAVVIVTSTADAATTPSTPIESSVQVVLTKIASLKVKELQKITGRKLTLKEKVGFMLLKGQIKRGNGERVSKLFTKALLKKKDDLTKVKGKKAEGSKKGESAFIFGIAGLALLVLAFFVPYVIIPSIVSAILAIVLGTMAKNENGSDSKAKAGKLMGWLTLGIIAVLLLVVAVALSNADWW